MNIDEAAGLMDLDLTLTLYWRDTGVSLNDTVKKEITINPEQDNFLSNIWTPDIAIDQATFFTTSFGLILLSSSLILVSSSILSFL